MHIQDPVTTIENCRYCLMCRHVSPVERVTFEESLTPHGWALTIASVQRGLLAWDEDTVDRLYSAPDGGNSRAHCVTNQPLPEAIAATRAEVTGQQLAPAVVYEVNDALREWQNPYKAQAPDKPVSSSGDAPREHDVALFVGDAAHYLEPQTLEAALALLEMIGVQPVLIGAGRNNGYLASSLGFPDTGRELARATLDELSASGARQMLVLSAEDFFTFNQLYAERLDIEWPEEVALQEVTTLLAQKLDEGALAFAGDTAYPPYAYVDPTHAVRVPQRHDAPRALAAAALGSPPRELFWRRERAQPAGNTSLQFSKPAIAAALTRERLLDGQRTGAKLLVTEDPGTLHELKRAAGELDLEVKGLYELLAERIVKEGSATGD